MLIKKTKIIYAVIVIMTAISIIWLSYEFWRLLWQPGEMGAIDLRLRYEEVKSFFEGILIYQEISHAVYPPASYIILWPFLGWLSESNSRIFWALTSSILLIVLIFQIGRESGAIRLSEKLFWILLPLSMYATGATIGNGQLAVHILPCLLGCLLVIQKKELSWSDNLLAAFLMLLALVKPTMTAPFFWILIFKSLRSAFLVSLGYVLLTIFASLFQPSYGAIELFQDWLSKGIAGASWGSTQGEGFIRTSINAHSILGVFELSDWNKLASLSIVILLGIWIYYNKHRDIWILASVAAIVAKFWTYQGWYDDLILLIPIITLFKISEQANCSAKRRYFASLLFIAMFCFTLAPGGTYLFPDPWNFVYLMLQTIMLCIVLCFIAMDFPRYQHSNGSEMS